MDALSISSIVNFKKHRQAKQLCWTLNIVEKILNAALSSKDEITVVVPLWAQLGTSRLCRHLGMTFSRSAKVENQLTISWRTIPAGAKLSELGSFQLGSMFTVAVLDQLYAEAEPLSGGKAFKMATFCSDCGFHVDVHKCGSKNHQRVELNSCKICKQEDHLTVVCPNRGAVRGEVAGVKDSKPTVALESAERFANAIGLTRCGLCKGEGSRTVYDGSGPLVTCTRCMGTGGYFVGKRHCILCARQVDYHSTHGVFVCCKQVYVEHDLNTDMLKSSDL